MGSKGQKIFSEVRHDAYYIKLKGKTCRTLYKFDLMYIPDSPDIEIVKISIFY